MSDVTIGPDATVTVLGRSRLEVQPDFARVSFVAGVEHSRRQHAIDRATVKVDNARRLLAGDDGPRRVDFSGLSVTVAPEGERTAYRAWSTGRFEASDAETVARVIQRLVEQGDCDILSIDWHLDEGNSAVQQVRAAAVRRAIEAASVFAETAGGYLGPLLYLADPGTSAAHVGTAPAGLTAEPAPTPPSMDAIPVPLATPGSQTLTVDPVPQVLHAVVEARFQVTPT